MRGIGLRPNEVYNVGADWWRRKSYWPLNDLITQRHIPPKLAKRFSDSGTLFHIHPHVRFHLHDGCQ